MYVSISSLKGCIDSWQGDGICDDQNNIIECGFDGGDCCLLCKDTSQCSECKCHEGGAVMNDTSCK